MHEYPLPIAEGTIIAEKVGGTGTSYDTVVNVVKSQNRRWLPSLPHGDGGAESANVRTPRSATGWAARAFFPSSKDDIDVISLSQNSRQA